MTKKVFRLTFLFGLLLLGSLFAGCGAFGGDKDKINALQLQNDNLSGRLEAAERDRDRAEGDAQDLEAQLSQAKSESTELKQQLASKPAVSPTAPGTTKITVSGSVLFRAGAAELTAEGKSKLDSVAAEIKSQYPGRHISVEGHTDSSPLRLTKDKWGTNMWLSANRARAVADHLISRGIAENLVSVRGWGAGRPTGMGPEQDRRVEIVILSN